MEIINAGERIVLTAKEFDSILTAREIFSNIFNSAQTDELISISAILMDTIDQRLFPLITMRG